MEDIEYQMVSRTGEVLDVLMSAILERDEVGSPLRSMAVTQDVTARRRVRWPASAAGSWTWISG